MKNSRRDALRKLTMVPALAAAPSLFAASSSKRVTPVSTEQRVQYSVNAYSFNDEFKSGKMDLFDMMEFAADIGLNAVDLTSYYFSTYPNLPDTAEIFALKKRALELGLNISWTGVRNNFVTADVTAREKDRQMIKDWLAISSQIGSSILRMFTGRNIPEGYTKDQVKAWLVEEYKLCAQYGAEVGVIAALQNHNEFLFTADEVIDIVKRVDSEWFGLILDTACLRTTADPYAEAEKLAPYANYWFIKEHVYPNQEKTPTDMAKMAALIKKQGFQGYVSFESLSDGDPKVILKEMLAEFQREFKKG
ncbi:sugar phosphate isomerase/epimerase family protein [Croceivirga sp. JEA036]|uniref:sugar phosphate isomerase/epimerase family protein n=1 Tax=Croceivirga sp. JEA036 TaxID=2721162 RepID=UPI00143A462A|nr:sugar phosphate isomerase/epimerase family protein [Croceivirga sp. JEA036]NJB35098.1 sugar phosphate isomerase/epimerase [Croceivirga sp. JEA036]